MDENLRTRLRPEDRRADELRAWRGFGIGLGGLLLLAAWRALVRGGPAPALAALALSALATATARPRFFRPAYALWMPVARLLARINTRIVCAVLYYAVLTPYAVAARLLGVRFLETDLRDNDSYWKVRSPRDPVKSSRRSF